MIINEKKINFAKSKYGRIEFRYTEGMSTRGEGDIWVENKVSALLNGSQIGYLKINWIPKATFATKFKDIINFLIVQGGHYDLSKAVESGDIKKIIEKMARLDNDYSIANKVLNTETDINWQKDAYNKLLKNLTKKHKTEFKKFQEYWVDKPMIDYISVDSKYQLGGVGFGLYIAGAMWMAEKGFPLRSGASRSEAAMKAWNKLKRMSLPVKSVSDAGIPRNMLDYR